ncbi:MAG: nuclear transport factor 2 family protein [Polyangiaceae bacterium]
MKQGRGRRALFVALACALSGLLAYQFVPRDETRIADLLEQLCSRLNQTRDAASLERLRQTLPGALDPQVRIRIVELDEEWAGLTQVSTRADELLAGAPLSFALNSVQIQAADGHARVNADLLVTVSGSGEQRRDLRRTSILLRKASAGWRIERVEIDPVADSEPEPRP